MNKMTRFGIIVLVLGLSFTVLAVIRGGSTVSGGLGVQFGSYGSQTATFFWVPRDLKLRVDSGEGVNINLVDPSQVTILKAEDVKEGDTFTVHLEKRGTYTLLFYNPSNSTTEIDLYFALYNLESDIVLASVILIISGTIIIVARSLYVAYKNRMIQMPKR